MLSNAPNRQFILPLLLGCSLLALEFACAAAPCAVNPGGWQVVVKSNDGSRVCDAKVIALVEGEEVEATATSNGSDCVYRFDAFADHFTVRAQKDGFEAVETRTGRPPGTNACEANPELELTLGTAP